MGDEARLQREFMTKSQIMETLEDLKYRIMAARGNVYLTKFLLEEQARYERLLAEVGK